MKNENLEQKPQVAVNVSAPWYETSPSPLASLASLASVACRGRAGRGGLGRSDSGGALALYRAGCRSIVGVVVIVAAAPSSALALGRGRRGGHGIAIA